MKKKYRFHFYRFVNRPGWHSTGFIAASVRRHGVEFYAKNEWTDVESHLSIKDCDREINLSLDTRGDKSFDNTLFKIDTMIEGLQGLRAALIEERKTMKKGKRLWKKREKAKKKDGKSSVESNTNWRDPLDI